MCEKQYSNPPRNTFMKLMMNRKFKQIVSRENEQVSVEGEEDLLTFASSIPIQLAMCKAPLATNL